jgi:hypothetical protein
MILSMISSMLWTRVVTPNVPLLKDVLVIGGMPEPTQNLQVSELQSPYHHGKRAVL